MARKPLAERRTGSSECANLVGMGIPSSPQRHLDWPGLHNVRDLGGLPTRDGGSIRPGALVRSEGLDRLDPAGWDRLHGHGVRTLVDLRSDFEIDAAPYASSGDLAVVQTRWEEGLLADPEFADWAATGLLSTCLYYRRFLERWPERTATTVRAVAEAAPGGVLVHCAAGRDRTGLITALLLSLVGVPHDLIVADYLASDARILAGDLDHQAILEVESALFTAAGTTSAAEIAGLLQAVDVATYLRDAGLADDVLTRLHTRLVTA